LVVISVAICLISCEKSKNQNAYEKTVSMGYTGSLEEWMAALVGETGDVSNIGEIGKSAYELAVEKGFSGNESDWLSIFTGVEGIHYSEDKTTYDMALEYGFVGTLSEWLTAITQ